MKIPAGTVITEQNWMMYPFGKSVIGGVVTPEGSVSLPFTCTRAEGEFKLTDEYLNSEGAKKARIWWEDALKDYNKNQE